MLGFTHEMITCLMNTCFSHGRALAWWMFSGAAFFFVLVFRPLWKSTLIIHTIDSPFSHLKHNFTSLLAVPCEPQLVGAPPTWGTPPSPTVHTPLSPTLSLLGQWHPSFPSNLPVTLWGFRNACSSRTSSSVLTPRMPPPSNVLGLVGK